VIINVLIIMSQARKEMGGAPWCCVIPRRSWL